MHRGVVRFQSVIRFVDTKTTFDNYRKEAERLLLWSVVQMGKPLSLARQRTRHAKSRITCYLSPEL